MVIKIKKENLMIAKFIALLLLLIVFTGLVYVAIVDVDIPQQEKIVSVKAEPTANEGTR
ncbi:MAG: hypothetical protein AAF244_03810 [Pseudomonadota bacterium]